MCVCAHQVTAIDTASSKIVFKETITYAGGDTDNIIMRFFHSKKKIIFSCHVDLPEFGTDNGVLMGPNGEVTSPTIMVLEMAIKIIVLSCMAMFVKLYCYMCLQFVAALDLLLERMRAKNFPFGKVFI